jgi:hypothetical protein
MTCLTVADFVLDKFGGDSIMEVVEAVERHRRRVARGPQGSGPAGRVRGDANAPIPAESE